MKILFDQHQKRYSNSMGLEILLGNNCCIFIYWCASSFLCPWIASMVIFKGPNWWSNGHLRRNSVIFDTLEIEARLRTSRKFPKIDVFGRPRPHPGRPVQNLIRTRSFGKTRSFRKTLGRRDEDAGTSRSTDPWIEAVKLHSDIWIR